MLKTKYKSIRKTSAVKTYNPFSISKNIGYQWSHFIIYPTTRGYCFALFFRELKTHPFEIIAGSYKPFKTKLKCIKAMKKTVYTLAGLLSSDHWYAFDHRGKKISMKIEYTVTRQL